MRGLRHITQTRVPLRYDSAAQSSGIEAWLRRKPSMSFARERMFKLAGGTMLMAVDFFVFDFNALEVSQIRVGTK